MVYRCLLEIRTGIVKKLKHNKSGLFSGIYLKTAMISHNCQPNTKHVIVNDEFSARVIALVNIRKGDVISSTYTQPFWGSLDRRLHLRMAKCFDCTCERCKDPTELATYLGTLDTVLSSSFTLSFPVQVGSTFLVSFRQFWSDILLFFSSLGPPLIYIHFVFGHPPLCFYHFIPNVIHFSSFYLFKPLVIYNYIFILFISGTILCNFFFFHQRRYTQNLYFNNNYLPINNHHHPPSSSPSYSPFPAKAGSAFVVSFSMNQ